MFAGTQPSPAVTLWTVTAGASGLIRALTLWLLLVPLALAAFILTEVIGVDLVDAVNALIYAFAAWVALALFRLGLPGLLDRLIWLGLALFCTAFVVSELGPDSLAQVTRVPEWLGDLLGWSLTGGFIGLICWRRPQARRAVAPVLALASAGFALHSLDLLIDFGEVRLNAWLGLGELRFDNITDLIEFLYLQLYLLAFIVLAAELSGRHALRSQIAAAENTQDSTEVIRAAHLAFATASLTSHRFSRRRRRKAMLALGGSLGLGAWANALHYTRRLGPALDRRAGIAPWRQFCAQLALMHRYRLAPKYYYMFELWQPEQARLAAHYLQRGETKGAAYKILHRRLAGIDPETQRLSDKLAFHDTCRAHGLSVAPIYFATGDSVSDIAALPAADLFVKPRKGCGGNGANRWRFDATPEPHYRDGDGRRFSPAELLEEIGCTYPSVIVQPRLVNHPALADLNCGALATVRMVTCRNESGGHEVTDAAFRMPRSEKSVVDNFHAGGIAAAIDIATGRLGAATDMGLTPGTAWFCAHATTGAEISGRRLPHWRQAMELAVAAHRRFDAFAVIGWDIAILADGPVIVEANGAPDLDIIQRTQRRPIGNARLGRLMAWHLRRRLRPALLGEE